MGTLYFKVASDWEEVVKLRGEIEKLKDTLRGMNTSKAPSDVEALEKKLESATQKYRDLVAEAAKSGATLEQNIKKVTDSFKIDASLDQLKVFDGELMKMCGNLDKYFDGVIGKIESMHSALKAGKIGIDDSSSSVPAHQLDDLRVKNAELTEQLSKQKDEIKQQQEEWNKLANAIKTNNVSAIDQYKQATGSSSDTIKSAKNELKGLTKELNENIEYYDKLAAQIASYKSILNRLYTAKEKGLTRVHIGDGATSLISSELERFKPQLDDATQKSKEISREIGVQKQRVSELNDVIEQGNQKHARTRTLIIDAREQLMQMRSAGLQNTAQYQQASEELGKMRKQMVLVNAEMDYLSNPNKNLAVFKAGLSGVASSASLVVGVMGLVNQKDEEMIMLQTKIQSLLGIIVGLEGSYNMIKKSSILMIAIENTQRKASIASQLLETKAKTTNIALTWSEVAAQKALNVVANANPYVLLATAMMTVVGGIWLLTKATGEAREQIENFNKEVAETASTPIAKVEELSSKWNRLGNNLESKKKFVENNKKAFDELGIAILNVTDAENLLNNNKDAFIKAMIERAKATEYLKEQKDNIAKLIKAEQEIEDAKNKTFRAFDSKTAEGLRELAVAAAQSNYDKIANSIKQGYTKAAQAESEGTKILNDARLKGIDDADNLMDDYTYKMTTGVERGNESFKRFAESVSKGYNSMLGSMSDDTLSFSQKVGNMLGTLFNLGDVDNSGALTIGQRTSMLRADYAKALRSLKELRSPKSTATQKEIDDAQKEVNKIADIYKNITGKAIDDNSASKEAEKQAKKQKENQEKLNESLLSLQRQNQQDEANLMEEGTEKKLAQIKADFDAQDQAIKKKAKDFAKINKESSVRGVNADGLTTEQQSEIDKANKLNSDNQVKQEGEVYKAELESMRNYLKEYGTFQQQKLAIAEEYAEKIRKAQSDGERLTLEKQRDANIQQVDINSIKQAIDWGSVFGEFGTMFKEQIQPTIDNLRAIAQTKEFKSSSLLDQQTLYDLIEKLEQSNAAWDSDIFKRVSDDMIAYQSAMLGYINAQNREKEAVNALASAKENLKHLEESGGNTSEAELAVKQAKDSLNNASGNVQKFSMQVQETTSNLESSSAKAIKMFQSLESGLQGLTSGNLKGIGQGIMQLDKLFNRGKLTDEAGNALAKGFQSLLGKDSKASKAITEALGGSGMAGQILSAVLGILDTIAEVGVSGIITNLQDTILGSVDKMLSDVLSGDIIMKPIKNGASHIGKILNTVTFGGFNSLFGIGGNAKETADKIAQLTSSNDALKVSIDALKDEIKGSNGSKSISAYNEARDAQKRYEENLRQILDSQMGYHSSHHSNSYYWNLNKNSLSQVNSLLGTNLGNSWGDFSKLTADQMNEIRKHLPDIWSEMIDQGKYGDRFKDDWNNYADQAGKVLEMTDNLRESLTQISFDSLRDSFVDSLMDMDKKASDFASDFQKYMTKALLDFAIGDLLDDEMKEWYESWAETMNNQDGKLTDKQVDDYAKWWDEMVNKGLAKRDEIAKLTGYTGDSSSSSQSASSKGYQTMSQDAGEELKGRFTALQAAGEEIKRLNMEQTMSLKEFAARAGEILTVNSDIRNIADDTRNILASTYLETVEIKENTGAIIKPIKSMAADIAEVKQNTKGLSSR